MCRSQIVIFQLVSQKKVLFKQLLLDVSSHKHHHSSLFRPGDAEDLQQLQVSDDLRQPEQPPLPAGRQRRAAGAAGRPQLGQSELDAGLRRPGELGTEAALRAHAVSGQTPRTDVITSRSLFNKTL